MPRNLFALAALLAVLAAGIEARAACTAANPNANVAEATPTATFTDNGDGTVTHSLTGLMWKQCAEGLSGASCGTGSATTMTWAQALTAAKTATTAGHSDWRLPNKKELESIVETCGYSPAINQTLFPSTPTTNYFWSGSSYGSDTTRAWNIGFDYGAISPSGKANNNYVRLVRSGQSFSSFDSFPGYQSAALNAGLTVATLTFNEALVNNLADLPTLKAAVTFAADGTTFNALAAGDAVALSGSTLTVTFASALSGTTNKIKIAANSLKDAVGNVLASAVTTAALDATDTIPNAFVFTAQSGAALSAATTSDTITVAGINSAAAITIAGGSYAINGGAYTTGAGTVNNGDTVTVQQTSSGSYSTLTSATLTVGGVSAAFNVTTQAAPAPVYYDPPAPSVINAPRAVDTTLTGTTPVNAALGSTLTISAGAPVSGVAITLATPVAGVAAEPVAIRIGGNALAVTPLGANVVVTLKTMMLNGVPTPVLAVSSGTLTVSAAPGQPLLTVSNSGVVVTAGTNGGAVAFDGSGAAILSVTSGYVVLPANAFASVNGFAALQDGKLYAGEVATLDATGKVTSVRLGSLAGDGGAVGDALKTAGASGLINKAVVPNLKGKVARVSDQQEFADAIAASLGKDFTVQGQNGDGVLRLAFAGGTVNALPVGSIAVDTSRADGVTFANGKAEVAKSGVVTTFSPAVSDFAGLAGQLVKQDKNATLAVLEDGMIHVILNGVTYALQPGWTVSQAGGGQAGITVDGQGNILYQDGAGNRQTLYPVFADLPQLLAVFRQQDAEVSVTANGDGTYGAKLQGKSYTLAPDYSLPPTPADKAGKEWWQGDDGKIFIRNRDGSAQGFAVR